VKNTKQKPSMLQSTSSRFITLGGALPSSDKAYAKALWTPDKVNMWTLWRTWHKIVRYLDVLPQAKRVYSVTMNGPLRAHERLMATSARTPLQLLTGDMVLSKPFNPRWNRDEPMNFVDGVDQDMFDLEQEERWI